MSHVADVKLFVKDLALFRQEVEALGGTLHEGQKTHGWYGSWQNDYHGEQAAVTQGFDPAKFGQCEHAVSIPGCDYELGLVPRVDGGDGYAVIYDNWSTEGRKLQTAFGDQLGTLKGGYAKRVAMKHLRQQGYRTRVIEKAGGVRQVVGTRIKRG